MKEVLQYTSNCIRARLQCAVQCFLCLWALEAIAVCLPFVSQCSSLTSRPMNWKAQTPEVASGKPPPHARRLIPSRSITKAPRPLHYTTSHLYVRQGLRRPCVAHSVTKANTFASVEQMSEAFECDYQANHVNGRNKPSC